jgi:nanoRNase/pAp phosphatase (c-di-AMP/oligoRNAs hydrolase)
MSTGSSGNDGKRKKTLFEVTGPKASSFLKLFGPGDNVLVLINPDPDSMASAFAVKRLLRKRAKKTTIGYIGEITRLENRAMMELLGIGMVSAERLDADGFSQHILVDSQPSHSELLEGFSFDAIIDHHPRVKKWKTRYEDIRPEYGAASTILTEYLQEVGIKPSMKLATGLLYGIKTDTGNLEQGGTEADIHQFRYLLQYANMNLLRKIEKSELRLRDLNYFKTAIEKRVVTKKGLYTHLGEIPSADICVQIADFFMGVYGMNWSFVSGVYKGKLIVILRNDGYRKDAGKLAESAFGSFGSAGGRRRAARAEIALDSLSEAGIEARNAQLKKFVRSHLNI